jgi:hypothetical protein
MFQNLIRFNKKEQASPTVLGGQFMGVMNIRFLVGTGN